MPSKESHVGLTLEVWSNQELTATYAPSAILLRKKNNKRKLYKKLINAAKNSLALTIFIITVKI